MPGTTPAENSKKTVGRPFPPGVSGNPGGRPKNTPLASAYRDLLDKKFPDDPAGRTYAQVLAERVLNTALSPSDKDAIAAAREVADRAEGKPLQSVEVSTVDVPSEEKLEFIKASGFVLSRTK